MDVVVVGAGASGLAAARTLLRSGKSVVVLEANDRVGGRLKASRIAGQVIDLGGQWVGPTQTRALALAAEYGMGTFPTPSEGRGLSELPDGIYGGRAGALPEAVAVARGEIVRALGLLVARVSAAAPWTADDAARLDAMSLETWVDAQTPSQPARELFRVTAEALVSTPPSQISALAFASHIRAGGAFRELVAVQGGAQQDLFHGGFHQLTAHLARELGARVVLGAPVDAISQTVTGVTVASGARVWRATRVIVSVPPSLVAHIRFSPLLPPARVGLQQRWAMGSVIKAFVAYERPFWREAGVSGQIVSTTAAFNVVFDGTAPGNTRGVLVGFFDGGPAQRWADRSVDDRRRQVVDDLSRVLGPSAGQPIDYVEQVWAQEPWCLGGYGCVPAVGALTTFGEALVRPVGRIHWAGSDTSDVWRGYVDGALRSGERAAQEVLAAG